MAKGKQRKSPRMTSDTRFRKHAARIRSLEQVVGMDDIKYPLPEGVEAMSTLDLFAREIGVEPEHTESFGAWLRDQFYRHLAIERAAKRNAEDQEE